MAHINLTGQRLEYEFVGPSRVHGPTLVFLHEGLGSVALWKDFPLKVAVATGCRALMYSRYGYGSSSPLTAPREPDFMHVEALNILPQLLSALQITDPVLFGHSDGASIALINAGAAPHPPRGLIVMAPHVMVEDVCVTSISAAKQTYEMTNWREKLRRYHDDPDGAFRGWCDIWLDHRFRHWNIEELLPGITCPVLAIQGLDDEYGTMEQIDRIARAIQSAELLKLPACGHSPHRDHPEAVISAVTRHVERIRNTPPHITERN